MKFKMIERITDTEKIERERDRERGRERNVCISYTPQNLDCK